MKRAKREKKRPEAKPIEIIPGKGRHKTEQRVFARNIHESFCMQRGCRFYKQHAQQGVCHTTKTFQGLDWKYLEAIEKDASAHVAFIRQHYRKDGRKKYIERLESEVTCFWTNSIFNLDELVYLRRELAIAQKKLAAKAKKRK